MSRPYKKYEFCKAMNCDNYWPATSIYKEHCNIPNATWCQYTAKDFHEWLKAQGFAIIREETSE